MDGAPMAERRRKIHACAHKITKRLAQFKKLLYLCTRKICFCHNVMRNDLAVTAGRFFFVAFFRFYGAKLIKKKKKEKKIKKNAKKFAYIKKMLYLCTEFKKQPQKSNQIKSQKVMNKTYFTKSLGQIVLDTKTINKNFRIKVAGIVDGVRVNKLVGVRGLLAFLGSWQKLVKMVLRAFDCLDDKCACKIYGGAKVTFYAK